MTKAICIPETEPFTYQQLYKTGFTEGSLTNKETKFMFVVQSVFRLRHQPFKTKNTEEPGEVSVMFLSARHSFFSNKPCP